LTGHCILVKGDQQQVTANDRPHPGFAAYLKSHITAPFSPVLFIRIVRLNLLDVLNVIWELNALTGAGYPKGFHKEQILLESQIIAVADVYEAMISHRPYRPSPGKQAAIEELSRNRGLLYNADAVDVCLNLV
jgi:hypothetical protein